MEIIRDQLTQKDVDRFASKIIYPGNWIDCWGWEGAVDKDGYGRFSIKYDHIKAHRFSFIIYYKDIKPNMLICHKCDNPSCTKPDHLFEGTHSDNNLDRTLKGRSTTVLKESIIKDMLNRIYNKEFRHMTEVGQYYGVTRVTVREILNGNIWSHVTIDSKVPLKNIKAMISNDNYIGSNNKASKLSEHDVKSIKLMLSQGISHRNIARKFNVGSTCITNINLGKTWTHV